ncbi:MAG: glycosyltransferase [Bacteroidales bacterium]|nr:glycosyltransferase [Candidatus Physcousia equi]
MNILLFIDKLKLACQKRWGKQPQKKRCYAAWTAKGHVKEPLVSFVIQSHDKSLQVCHILPTLRRVPQSEIVVIDDGSALEHTQRLAAALTGANEFLVRANDLYENITYDKCLRFANGKYVCLLQDDDELPGTAWVDEAVRHFEQHPAMVILGGCDGRRVRFCEMEGRKTYTSEEMSEGDFSFVMSVNRAPMWINRALFRTHLHHIDYRFAPFQSDDYELCMRAWMLGLQVGWYRLHFESLSPGGMRLYNSAFTREMTERNAAILYDLYADKEEEIMRRVGEAKEEMRGA